MHAAAAIVVVHALFFLDESAAGAKNDEFLVCVVQAAAAWVAATVALHSGVRVIFIGIFLCWNWILDFTVGVFIVSRSVERTKKHQFAGFDPGGLVC